MNDPTAAAAASLRAEAVRARRMGAAVSDPLTRRLLAEYADECEEAAARLEADPPRQ